jgi:aryl-alcohol dehydrogenase-like predicted oxidoreductase
MSAARELTPEEVAEGRRGITDELLTATQIQALVKRMDASKTKWRKLRRQGKTAEYEAKLKEENESLYFNYPSLFQMHAEDRLDQTFFEMLQLKRRIEKGEITAEQASTLVGQQLFSRFVPQALSPSAPPPAPRLSYEEYCRQMGQE